MVICSLVTSTQNTTYFYKMIFYSVTLLNSVFWSSSFLTAFLLVISCVKSYIVYEQGLFYFSFQLACIFFSFSRPSGLLVHPVQNCVGVMKADILDQFLDLRRKHSITCKGQGFSQITFIKFSSILSFLIVFTMNEF